MLVFHFILLPLSFNLNPYPPELMRQQKPYTKRLAKKAQITEGSMWPLKNKYIVTGK